MNDEFIEKMMSLVDKTLDQKDKKAFITVTNKIKKHKSSMKSRIEEEYDGSKVSIEIDGKIEDFFIVDLIIRCILIRQDLVYRVDQALATKNKEKFIYYSGLLTQFTKDNDKIVF